MSVIIGSARHDENGKYSGGKAGDQDGTEVSTQEFYMHSKGWTVIRAKSSTVRQKIADCMQWSCDNWYIGYDQSQRDTLYQNVVQYNFDVRKLITPCETDCSALIRVCVRFAGITVPDFYTGNAAQVLKNTGFFDVIDFPGEQNLMRGDILCTKTKGHIVAVLSDGSNIKDTPHWIQSAGKWYYINSDGHYAIGWQPINNHWYFFEETGEMLTGAHRINGEWCFFWPDGDLCGAMCKTDDKGYQQIWNIN